MALNLYLKRVYCKVLLAVVKQICYLESYWQKKKIGVFFIEGKTLFLCVSLPGITLDYDTQATLAWCLQ